MTFFSFSEVLQIFVLLCWNTKANDFHIIISVSEKLQEIMQRIVAPVDIFHLLPSEPVVTAQITGLLYCFILIRDSGVHMYGCVCVCVSDSAQFSQLQEMKILLSGAELWRTFIHCWWFFFLYLFSQYAQTLLCFPTFVFPIFTFYKVSLVDNITICRIDCKNICSLA